jgi:hypothetical protein
MPHKCWLSDLSLVLIQPRDLELYSLERLEGINILFMGRNSLNLANRI